MVEIGSFSRITRVVFVYFWNLILMSQSALPLKFPLSKLRPNIDKETEARTTMWTCGPQTQAGTLKMAAARSFNCFTAWTDDTLNFPIKPH